MENKEEWLSIGDKCGLIGLAVLFASFGMVMYGVGTDIVGYTYPFQTYPNIVAPLIIGGTGVYFLLLSYIAHVWYWKASIGKKAGATAVILFFAGIFESNVSRNFAIAIAILGAVCLLFALWQLSKPLFSRRRKAGFS